MLSSDQNEAEKTLRSLTPVAPSEAFRRRIEADFEVVEPEMARFGNPVYWLSVATVAAACLTVFLYIPLAVDEGGGPVLETAVLEESVLSAPLPIQPVEWVRIRGSSELVGVEKGPVYYDANGSPVQDSVLKYLDVEVFERLSDKEEVMIETIREEVRRMPVDIY